MRLYIRVQAIYVFIATKLASTVHLFKLCFFVNSVKVSYFLKAIYLRKHFLS